MSMNLYLYANREVVVTKTGGHDVQTIQFDLWQTPTEVTYKIMETDDRLEAYKDWVRERMQNVPPREVPVYAEDDVFGEDGPIGYVEYHVGEEHIRCLDDWVERALKAGYELEFSVM